MYSYFCDCSRLSSVPALAVAHWERTVAKCLAFVLVCVQAAARPARRSAVVCHASKVEVVKQISTGVAAAALAATVSFADVQPAYADIAGLTPCSESKAYAKLQKKELKDLEKRLKKVRYVNTPNQEVLNLRYNC